MSPSLSVIICSLDGAEGVRRCLQALEEQTVRPDLEVIVVDDGSTDHTSEVARAARAAVVRHSHNLGVSAARNSGTRVARAPIVAFLDDDCEPAPQWAETVLASFKDNVVAVGGSVIPAESAGIVLGYLSRHNPIRPQERNLAASNKVAYRFWLYLQRQWSRDRPNYSRAVVAVPSANMAVRRQALCQVGGFDQRIRFGAEDDDLCRRLTLAYPGKLLMFEPAAVVLHHFESSLSDVLRRSRAYGQASATMHLKWPDVRPTFFPFPELVLAILVASIWSPWLIAAALVAPLGCYPRALRDALADRRAGIVLDAYLQLMQETAENYGFIRGLWRFRDTFSDRADLVRRSRFAQTGDAPTRPD